MSSRFKKEKLIKQIQKILFIIVALTIIIFGLFFYTKDKYLHVYFMDVGQGDSIYVRYMNKQDILIDGGPNEKVLFELGRAMPFWDHKIELVILTHPHSDHIAGLIEVIKKYDIEKIIMTDATHTSNEYLEFLKVIKEKNIPVQIISDIQSISIDNNLSLNMIWPKESFKDKKIDNLNNTSIVALLKYDQFNVLLTGDIETEVQEKIIKENKDKISNINILKVAHHGSEKNLQSFIKIANPDIGVISVGKNNQFHHPSDATIKNLDKYNVKVLRTDENGTIEIISNGKYFWTKTHKE